MLADDLCKRSSKAGIAIFLEWTAKQNVLVSALHVIMEATCVYHEQAALSLIEAWDAASLCGPKRTRWTALSWPAAMPVAEDLRREKNRLEKAEAADTPPRVLQSILDAVSFHAAELKRLQQDVDDHINSHSSMKQDMKLLTSIPAVGPQTGSKMLAVMKARHFQSAEQLAAYLGLVPVERQSGSLVLGRPRLSKPRPSQAPSCPIHGRCRGYTP